MPHKLCMHSYDRAELKYGILWVHSNARNRTVLTNNNNVISLSIVYDAVITTIDIAGVQPVYLMNADTAPYSRRLSNQASWFVLWVRL